MISDTEKEAKAPAFDSSQQQVGSVYGAQHSGFGVADASHSYYQVDFLAFHSFNVFLFLSAIYRECDVFAHVFDHFMIISFLGSSCSTNASECC